MIRQSTNRGGSKKRPETEARRVRPAHGPEVPETAPEISQKFPDIDPAEFFDPEEFGIRKSDQRP